MACDATGDRVNQTPAVLEQLRNELLRTPIAELPAVIGHLEAVKAEAFARLFASPMPHANVEPNGSVDDRLLTVAEVAQRIGQTPRWVRDHKDQLPRVSVPGRALRFSESRLAMMIRRRPRAA